jgi:acyl-CoA thioesterase FadM
MNVMYYVGKFDEATWSLFVELGLTPSLLRDHAHNMAAVQQNISYKRELLAGDVVAVRSAVLEMRDKVIRFVHEMRNAELGEIAAVCELTAVTTQEQPGLVQRRRGRGPGILYAPVAPAGALLSVDRLRRQPRAGQRNRRSVAGRIVRAP